MSLACSPPAEGLNALNYTEKKKSINEAGKKKKTKKLESSLKTHRKTTNN